MDLSYSNEQEALRNSANKFLAARPRKLPARNPGVVEEGETWAAIAGMGWLGLMIDEEYDGLGLGHVDLAIVTEAFGRHLQSIPYVPTVVLAGSLIKSLSSTVLKRLWLPQIASGAARIGFAHLEGGTGGERDAVSTVAVRQGDAWVLKGSKCHTLDGNAGEFLVTATTTVATTKSAPTAVFLVSADTAGVSITPHILLDGSTAAVVELSNVKVQDDSVIGLGERTEDALHVAINSAIIANCGELTGIADALLTATVAYINTREQFGRAISSNQVVRHRVVDMAIALEEARAVTLRAAILMDTTDSAVAASAVSAAKSKVGKAARYIAEQSVQLHGAIGVTEELGIGAYLKRVLALEPLFGSPSDHELNFARRRFAAATNR